MLMPIERNPRNLLKSAIECIILTIRHRKDRTVNHFVPKPGTLKYFEENFKMLHRKLKKTGKTGDDELYNRIIFLNHIEDLYLWASHVLSVVDKEAKVPEKKPATGFFGLWGKKATPEQVKVVEENYETLFKEIGNNPLPKNCLMPKDFVKIRFELNLAKGVFKLVDSGSSEDKGFAFSYAGLKSAASLKVEGFEIELSMNDMMMVSERDQQLIIEKVTQDEDLWVMKFVGKPDEVLAWSLDNAFGSLQINYNLNVMQSLMSFFVVPKTQNSAKIAAWDTLKGIQDTTQGALTDLIVGDTQFKIKIKCSAPRLKLPSPTQQGEFFISLGDISIENIKGEDYYENFMVSIDSLGMTYNKSESQSIPVIPVFSINSDVQLLKKKFKYKPKNKLPELIFSSILPEFRIICNASVYNQLMKLHKNFDFNIENLEASSDEVKIEGLLKRLTPGMHAWKEVHTKLIGGYLYFSNTSTFYIKDCSLHDVSEEYKQDFSIKLQNIYGDCVIAFPNSETKERWVHVLSECINEFESRTSLATSSLKKNSTRIIYQSAFKISKTEILITDEHLNTLTTLQMNELSSTVRVKEAEFRFSGTLGQMMMIEDKSKKFGTVFRSLDQRELIKIDVNYIDSKSRNYKGKGLIVEIKCGDVEICWNYDLITEILNFFQFAEYSDPARMIEETYGVVDKDHILLDLKIKSESLALALVNHRSQLAIAELRVSSFDSNVSVQNSGYLIQGTLDKLEMYDMTNYPATALKEEIKPYRLLGVREQGDVLRFSLMIYADKFKERDLDISSVVEVEMGGIDIYYLHQPFMRIIDYLNYHVLGVFDTQGRARKINQASMIKPEIFEEKLSFTSISVKINQPIVYLPPRPGFEDELSINLGVITVANKLEKANNPGWQDIYQISMQKLYILSRNLIISDQIDLNLEVTRKILTSEHLKNPNLDKTYLISGKSKEIHFKLSQRDYNLLLRTSDLNLLYDDQLESFISPTYIYTPPSPGKFLSVSFEIPVISVLLTYNSSEIINILLVSSTINFTKFNNTTISFDLNSDNVLGLIPESAVMSKSQDLKSMAEMVFSLSAESLKSFNHIVKTYPFILFGPSSRGKTQIFTIQLRTDMNSNKSVDISIKSVRINFHLSLFYQILNYSVSGVPNYSAASETPQDYMTKYKPKAHISYCVPRIIANVNLTQSFIWLPSTSKNRVLVAQGDLIFMYLRERQGNPGPINIKRLMLDKLEIFQSKSEEFLSQPQRKLLEPLQFIYEVKHFDHEIKENYVIGSFNCALSYKDLVAVQSTFKYQAEMLAKDDSIINLLQGYDNLQIVEDRMKSVEETMMVKEIEKKSTTTYSFAGLNFIVINDALTAYTPILDLSISIGDSVLKKEYQDGKSTFRGGLQASSSYYNPVSNIWEPFIEPFFIETEIVSSKNESIQNQYIFSVPSDIINLNCSEVMVNNLQEILEIWDSSSSSANDVISPFQIKNEVGYTIMVEYKNTKDVAIVESGSSQDYIVDYYSRAKNDWKSDSITVSIFPGDFAPPKLKIKTSKVQCYSCKTGNQVLVVDIELKSTRKILTVRSPLIVENQTDFLVKIHFVKTGKMETREVDCNGSVPVPYDMITGVCGFEILGHRSSNTNLENMWSKNKTSTVEVQVGNIYLYLYYKISKASSNKRTLYIKSPLKIKNCIPLDLGLRIYKGHPNKFEEIVVKQQDLIGIYSYSLKSEMFLSIAIEGYSRSNLLNILSQDSPSSIKVTDRKQQELHINILRIFEGCIFIVFYVPQVIINNSLNPLAFYSKTKGSEKMLSGQDFTSTVLPCNNSKKLIIGLGNTRSKAFLTDSVGVKDIIELIGDTNPAGHSYKYQYTLDVQISKVIESEMVFCKIIVISPRFLLVNNSNVDLIVAQDGFLEYSSQLAQGSRMPFHWAHKDGNQFVRFKGKVEAWNWSGAFSIENLATFTVQCKSKEETSKFLLMKVEVKLVDTTAHVIFETEQLQTASYRLINESRWFSLAVYQKSYAEDIRHVDTNTTCIFAWSNHLGEHEIIINFLLGKTVSESEDTHSMYILNLQKLNQILKIKIKNAPADFDVLYVSFYNEGPSKIVKFTDVPLARMGEKSDVILSYFNFSIPILGISIIEHLKGKSKELFYMTFTSIVLLAQITAKEIKAELMIKAFQGDNQMYPDTIFPVFIHPSEQTIRNMLHMCFVLNKENQGVSIGCTNFETFEFLLQTFHLKLDTHSVKKLIDLTDRLILKEKPVDLHYTLNLYKNNSKFVESDKSVTKYYYFNFMKIHPIKIIVTYAPLKVESNKRDLLSGIAQVGMALGSIEEAPVKLYAVQLNQAFASEMRLKGSLKSHYKSQLYNEFYSLIGHSNILGNPIGLLNDLGTGVVDFFYEPAQGIVNGPISATQGLIKGTGSLIKNTVSGTFGTVSKITSGITTGLAALTQDSDYIAQRQKELAKYKPSNVVTGVGLGVMSFMKNVGQGISGLVTEPIKGFKKDKMEGMVKGGVRGIGGLFVKPLAGVFDMVSRSAEGIKNTANFNEELEFYKARYPRVIYGALRVIQVYNDEDAVLMQHLFRIKKNKYYDKEFVEQVTGVNSSDKPIIFAIFTDVIILISRQDGKIKWKVKLADIKALDIRDSCLIISASKKKKIIGFKVDFKTEQQNREVKSKIEKMK